MRRLVVSAVAMAVVGLLGLALAPSGEAGLVAVSAYLEAPDLAGANEFPGPGDPDGSGSAAVFLDAETGNVCWSYQSADIALPLTGAHIHRGAAGASGPIVIDFAVTPTNCITGVDSDLIDEIVTDPAGFYVNLHNAGFPAGAIRQQLDYSDDEPIPLGAIMDGDQEAPGPGGTGTGDMLMFVGEGGIVCWDLLTDGLSGPIVAMHIHSGAVGVPGPIVVDLQPAIWGEEFGCVVTTTAQMAAILDAPEDFYVNVHTAMFPAGEIRGQIEAIDVTDIFDITCDDLTEEDAIFLLELFPDDPFDLDPDNDGIPCEPEDAPTTTTSTPGAVTPIATRAPTAPPASAVTSTPSVTG